MDTKRQKELNNGIIIMMILNYLRMINVGSDVDRSVTIMKQTRQISQQIVMMYAFCYT